jgi:hypothetical protein
MGQKKSWIPYVTAVLALGGILFAQGLQNYVMVWDWPMNFGGKPFAAWPAFIPITFEAMVFWAALGSALIAIIAGKTDTIPQPPPLLVKTGATVDRFVLWISATDPKWDAARAEAFVRSLGADGVTLVDVAPRPGSPFDQRSGRGERSRTAGLRRQDHTDEGGTHA